MVNGPANKRQWRACDGEDVREMALEKSGEKGNQCSRRRYTKLVMFALGDRKTKVNVCQGNSWSLRKKEKNESKRLALDGDPSWFTLGLVKLLFKLVVSGVVDIAPAGCWTCLRFLTVSAKSWLLTVRWTLRVKTCLFFWRKEPCWRSVSLNRRS